MGAVIPHCVPESPFHQALEAAGIHRIHRGKVRDTYKLPDKEKLLVIATNRVSIFDFVLSALIPDKGAILTALTVFWLNEVLTDIPHHLVTFGKGIDEYLPPSVRGCTALHKNALVVRRLSMLPIECIVRGYLTGSGWASYKKNGTVCGIQLPKDLHDGSRIDPYPLFTPTTKAEAGHDEPLNTDGVIATYGLWTQDLSLRIYQRIANFCYQRNLIFADTKFEFGEGGILADEVATPDSSRIWDVNEWTLACNHKQQPPSYDKEIVRIWGRGNDIHNLDPAEQRDLEFVAKLQVPQAIIGLTASRYHEVFERITSRTLSDFQRSKF